MPPVRRSLRDSLTDLALLQREVNQLFEKLHALDRAERPTAGEWLPSVDVFDCKGQLVVVAEVPGLRPESLRVVCRDGQLILSGERREKRPEGATGFLCMERPHGRFTRSLPLDRALDVARANAQLKGGLLMVTIPRLKERRGRETVIPVERET
jgi:HSP20 family protein